ncbi:MAG: hypothetical protein ACK41O_19515 [Runella zeae]
MGRCQPSCSRMRRVLIIGHECRVSALPTPEQFQALSYIVDKMQAFVVEATEEACEAVENNPYVIVVPPSYRHLAPQDAVVLVCDLEKEPPELSLKTV